MDWPGYAVMSGFKDRLDLELASPSLSTPHTLPEESTGNME